jgi:hypothetical protein
VGPSWLVSIGPSTVWTVAIHRLPLRIGTADAE